MLVPFGPALFGDQRGPFVPKSRALTRRKWDPNTQAPGAPKGEGGGFRPAAAPEEVVEGVLVVGDQRGVHAPQQPVQPASRPVPGGEKRVVVVGGTVGWGAAAFQAASEDGWDVCGGAHGCAAPRSPRMKRTFPLIGEERKESGGGAPGSGPPLGRLLGPLDWKDKQKLAQSGTGPAAFPEVAEAKETPFDPDVRGDRHRDGRRAKEHNPDPSPHLRTRRRARSRGFLAAAASGASLERRQRG